MNEAGNNEVKRDSEAQRKEPSGACKRYCWTLNNPTDEDYQLISMVQLGNDVSFLVVGVEQAPTTGTTHLQGYVECVRRLRCQQVRTLLPFLRRAALFVARGSRIQNYKYCTKDGNVLCQIGEVPQYANRSDLEQIQARIRSGADELELAENHFKTWCRNYKAIRAYMALSRVSHYEYTQKEVFVYWGKTGSGKTRKVWENEPDGLWVWSSGFWFDGYKGQEAALFDDFDVNSGISFRFLLRILDGYPIDVPVKGGFVPWQPKRIYFTSNVEWTKWFPLEEDLSPLQRRITQVIHFN